MNCPYNHCEGKVKDGKCKSCGRKVGIRVNSDGEPEPITRGRPSHDIVPMSFKVPYRVSLWLKSLPNGQQAQVVNNALTNAFDELA